MKKHFIGFTLFSLIVASFVLVYAFFYAPACPPKEAVKPPVPQTVTRTEPRRSYCNLNRNKLSYEVLSSQYFVDENKIVSRIRVSLNGSVRVAPSKIYVGTTFSSAGNGGESRFGDYEVVENPFAESREKIVTVVSKAVNGRTIYIDENLYVRVSVSDYEGSVKSADVTQAKAVLFVYGEKTWQKNN